MGAKRFRAATGLLISPAPEWPFAGILDPILIIKIICGLFHPHHPGKLVHHDHRHHKWYLLIAHHWLILHPDYRHAFPLVAVVPQQA